jgi:MraZ protein
MFLGRFNHTVDEKGRLAIPARFRPDLQAGLVITRGTDRCLSVYPLSTWETLAAKLDALPLGDANARNLRRAAFAAAEPAELDKQGRIVLPERLRAYANLGGNIAVVGMNTYLELWDLQTWETLEGEVEAQGDVFAAHLAGQF